MKAARFHGPGDIRIDDVPEPTVGPGQVKVDVEWCGICGTDLHEYLEGPIFIPPKGSPHLLTGQEMPVVMGHEFAGVVSEVGEGVTHVKEGDRVAVEPERRGRRGVLSRIRAPGERRDRHRRRRGDGG
jgi:(R,R)-butanediol dehydrogenase / meso-butanediol dehydrogenase / diacetyl reductase